SPRDARSSRLRCKHTTTGSPGSPPKWAASMPSSSSWPRPKAWSIWRRSSPPSSRRRPRSHRRRPRRCAPRPPIRRRAQRPTPLAAPRPPLAETERRVQRLDTEAKTLARLLHVDTKNLWPAVIDQLRVEKGYEAALGAALGDDLEAPIEHSAPIHWSGADLDPD